MKRIFTIACSLFVILIAVAVCSAATLHWEHNGTGSLNGFRVYVNDMETPVAEVPLTQMTWEMTGLVIGQEYLVGVSAWNAYGESQKATLRFTYQESIEVTLPLQPISININFDAPATQ
jgi:hypothetical protein